MVTPVVLIALAVAEVAPPVKSSSAAQVPVAGPPALICTLVGDDADGVADTSLDCADVPPPLVALTL